MGTRMVVSADLEFAVDLDDGHTAHRTLRGFADALASSGLRLHVVTEDRQPLVSLGSVRAPWWQRRATRSRHMRIGGVRGGLTALVGRTRRRAGVLPAAGLWPPGTPYPLVPTFQRRPRRNVTTTHDPSQGGGPRLVAVPGDGIWRPELLGGRIGGELGHQRTQPPREALAAEATNGVERS